MTSSPRKFANYEPTLRINWLSKRDSLYINFTFPLLQPNIYTVFGFISSIIPNFPDNRKSAVNFTDVREL